MQYNKLLDNVSFEEYQKIEAINSTGLKQIYQSPAHYKAYQNIPHEQTEAMHFGDLFHKMLLQGDKYMDFFMAEPKFVGLTKDGRESSQSKEAKEKKAAWYATLPKDVIVVPDKFNEPLTGMLEAMKRHPFTKNLLKEGLKENTLLWQDKETYACCKARFDFITKNGHIVDIKTTRNAHPEYFSKAIYSTDNLYHIQAAHYCKGAEITGVADSENFIFVAIEKEPPYGISIHFLDAYGLGLGDQWRSHLMKKYQECNTKKHWPGYPTEGSVAIPPEWAKTPEV